MKACNILEFRIKVVGKEDKGQWLTRASDSRAFLGQQLKVPSILLPLLTNSLMIAQNHYTGATMLDWQG